MTNKNLKRAIIEKRITVLPQELFQQKDHMKTVLTDPYYAYYYARDVIQGRYKKVEEIIKQDKHYSWLYARDVIKGRWIEGEQVFSNDEWANYYYNEGKWDKGIDYTHLIK